MKRLAWRTATTGALACLALSACAPGRPYLENGQRLIGEGHSEEGLAELERAAAAEPGNAEYRMTLIRQREAQTNALLLQADAALRRGHLDEADGFYRRALAVTPEQPRARAGLDGVAMARRSGERVDEAERLAGQGKTEEAQRLLATVLGQDPTNAGAAALARRLGQVERVAPIDGATLSAAALKKPVSLDFHEAPLKSVFDALSRSTGLNFVFDHDVKGDTKVTLNINHMSIDDVIGVLTSTNQLERKILNENTVLIYPNTAAKQKDYVDLNVRTFYLANAEAKNVQTMLKTVLKTRDVYADDKLNSLTIRDTPEALRLAEKVIAAQDLADPEVMLEVEVLEVKRSHLLQLGIEPPGSFQVLNLVPSPSTVVSTATGNTTVQNSTLTSTQLTLANLRGLSSGSIAIDNLSANFHAENGNANILANPRIRVRNREKARILIGDRVPVITTTAVANAGTSESVNYLDVGLKLDVEPNVFLDDEVGVKISLEVSNIVREVRSTSGTLTYQIGTRQAATALRLKDGETQALAGLISDEDRKNASGAPGAVDLPVIGRLFSTQNDDTSKTEIVLLITPRVVRNIGGGPPLRYEYASGTETAPGAPPMRLQATGRITQAPSPSAGTGTAAPVSTRGEDRAEESANPRLDTRPLSVPDAAPEAPKAASAPLPAASSGAGQ